MPHPTSRTLCPGFKPNCKARKCSCLLMLSWKDSPLHLQSLSFQWHSGEKAFFIKMQERRKMVPRSKMEALSPTEFIKAGHEIVVFVDLKIKIQIIYQIWRRSIRTNNRKLLVASYHVPVVGFPLLLFASVEPMVFLVPAPRSSKLNPNLPAIKPYTLPFP